MFSFHKPKIYRSLHGCCICRAKSSSSRFTDSKRYERDFDQCFGIDEHRSGEICNACVLLVKRWKKLPVGSNRNWHHVVDARAGPGTKSMYKIKNRTKELPEDHSIMKKKHKHKHKKRPSAAQIHAASNPPPQSPSGFSDDIALGDEGFSDQYLSRTPSPGNSDVSDDEVDERRSQKSVSSGASCRRKQAAPTRFSSLIDLTYWKQTEICCGIIFKGMNGEVMVDPRLLHPCRTCKSFPSASASAVSKPCTRSTTKNSSVPASPSPASPSPPTRKPQRQNSESCASSDSGVSTPAGDHDDASLDMTYAAPATPPPPTLEPQLPQPDPSQRLVSYHNDDMDELLDEEDDDEDLEDDDSSFMRPVLPHFSSHNQGEQHFRPPLLVEEDSCASMDMTSEAAAAAVLDLSMGLNRQRFIPMQV